MCLSKTSLPSCDKTPPWAVAHNPKLRHHRGSDPRWHHLAPASGHRSLSTICSEHNMDHLIPLMPRAIFCLSLNTRAAQRQTIGGLAEHPQNKKHNGHERPWRTTRKYTFPENMFGSNFARLISSADRKACHPGIRLTTWSPWRRFLHKINWENKLELRGTTRTASKTP